MKKRYLSLQMKKFFKKYPVILLITLVTVCAMALCAYGVLSGIAGSDEKTRISVGIVGDSGDSYLGMGIYALKNIDTSRYAVDFREMTKTEAELALQKGDIHGYVELPPDFIKDVVRGKNTPATYNIKKSAVNFGSLMIGEITGTVSELITESQTSIYSMQAVARWLKHTQNLGTKTDKLNIRYIDIILGRSKIFDVHTIGVADSISLGGYYLCAIIMIFMMLWGISCASLFSQNSLALRRLLRSRGMSAYGQVVCESAAYFAITMLTVIIFATLAALLGGAGLPADELRGAGAGDFVGFALYIIPVVMMVCAMHIFIYEAVANTVTAVILQFVVAVAMGYVSGFFYPDFFFPGSVRTFASLLPAGIGFAYFRKAVTGLSVVKECMMCVIYCVLFALATVAIRKRRTDGDGR